MNHRIWLEHYAQGVPAEADVTAYPSVGAMFVDAVSRYRELPAFTCLGRTLTYGELDRLSCDFAGFLQHDLGMAKGERLSIMLPNVLQYPVAVFGALIAGLTVVNINPLYTARELAFQLRDSDTRAMLVLENFAHTAEEAASECGLKSVIVSGLGDLLHPPASCITNFAVRHIRHLVPEWRLPDAVRFRHALGLRRGSNLRPADVSPHDLAFLQYTSGTTGRPKGAMLSHANVIANMRQNNVWCGTQVRDHEEVVITPLPLYHMYSMVVNLLSYFNFGGHNILIVNPRDLPALVHEMKKHPFSVITGVNTLYKALLDQPGFAALDFSRLKSVVAGGAAVERSVAERWQAMTGVPIVEGYGMTEATAVLACNPLNATSWHETVGVPYPNTDISIRDESGAELAPGEVGEICARGPQIMEGYWNLPEETARAFTADGWFRTGDMGVMDAGGWLRLVDRKKDVIVVSGFKAYPSEIEDIVFQLPGVADAAAVGMPDAHSGEAVKLFVVRRDPALTADALLAHCRRNLAGYKCPKAIEFRDELPKTPIGKVLRRMLRESEPTPPAA